VLPRLVRGAGLPYDPDVTGSFRIHLQNTLANHCALNPRYSLRAFARRLGIDHSTLSQMLRGRRPFSDKTIRAFGRKLRLGAEQVDGFIAYEQLFPSNHAPDEIDIQQRILELAARDNFRPDVAWIAREIEAPVEAIHVALTQLLALDLLRMEDRDRWTVSKEKHNGTTRRAMADSRKGTRKG